MPALLTWRTRHSRARDSQPSMPRTAGTAWRIRTSLALLVIACLLPGVLLSTYFIVSDYRQHKEQTIQSAIAIARAAAANLDRDIAGITSGLRVLATSAALQTDDLGSFYTQSLSALPFQNISNYVLIDANGRQLLNTLKPWGTPLPATGNPVQLMRVFETGEPVLTDVFIGPVTGRPILALGVPVRRDQHIAYSLNAGIFPSRFTGVLTAQNLPRDWISAVLDSQGVIVVRNRDMERFAGKPAVPDLVRMANEKEEGVLETITLEGIPVITAFSRSRVSHWAVAVGIPRAQLTHELKRSLVTLLVVSTLLFTATLWVAWWLAINRVVNPANQLLQRMQRTARGEEPGPVQVAQMPHEFIMLEQGLADMGTQLKEREKALEAKLAAEAANRAKTAFLSRMSHELRTPLNAVLGFTQVLRMDPREPLSPRQLDMVRQIESSGQHLLAMISDVLDVSRIESGQMHIRLEAVDTEALVRECDEMVRADADKAGVHLDVQGTDGIGAVRADRIRLKQVLLNLLSNAIKYNRPGGRVILSVCREGAHLRFCVEDTGLGMTPEQARHLFEPFNRLGRNDGNTPGAGIGLVICKQLLELMGSDLHVQTDAGKGSLFLFELPCDR